MTPEPAQPAEAWLNDPASLENGEPAQENDDVRTNTVANPDGGVGVDRGIKGYPVLRDGSMKPAQPAESPEAKRIAVAKALARHPDSSWDDYEWEDMASFVRELFLEQADLAITAMLAATTARPTERGAVEEGQGVVGDLGKGFKFSEAVWTDAVKETNRLCYELDITNADHIVLWLEHQLDGIKGPLAYIACRILEAHEALALPATNQAAEVERLIGEAKEFADCAQTDGFDPSDALDLIREFAALATQPATGRTMGVSGDVDAALRDALSASTTEVAALQNGGERP